MLVQALVLLCAAIFMVDAAAIASGDAMHHPISQPMCGCTETITQYITRALLPRQQCPSPVTVTIFQAPPLATIVSEDPASLASYLSYASMLDSINHVHSSQDRPTGEPPETTAIYYTHTALGPAVVGTDDPNDASVLYHEIGTTLAPITTATNSFAAEVTPAVRLNGTARTVMRTVTTYVSYVTVTSPPIAATPVLPRHLEKRETCYMVFAQINGQWASWCNEWDGHTTVKYSSYETTVLVTNPIGADPIPASVWAAAKTSDTPVTIQTSPPEESTSTSTQEPANSTSVSSSSSSEQEPITTGIPVTATVTVTFAISTVTLPAAQAASTTTNEPTPSSSTCGQVGQFTISFDDLPRFSTSNPDNETVSPPIFAPYNHFYWSAGYGYGPPPNEPFQPHDGDRLAEYNPASETPATTSDVQGRDLPGSFGAGPRSFNSIFWFDAKSVFVGCTSTGFESSCYIDATGYRWVPSYSLNATKYDGHEVLAFTQQYYPDACTTQPCALTEINFDAAKFSGLSSLNLAAKVGNVNIGFYMDSFNGAWTNSTCEAGLERSTSRK